MMQKILTVVRELSPFENSDPLQKGGDEKE